MQIKVIQCGGLIQFDSVVLRRPVTHISPGKASPGIVYNGMQHATRSGQIYLDASSVRVVKVIKDIGVTSKHRLGSVHQEIYQSKCVLSSIPFKNLTIPNGNGRQQSAAMFTNGPPTEEQHSKHTLEAIGEILNRKTSVAQIMSKTVEGLNHTCGIRHHNDPEDLIFELFRVTRDNETHEVASISKLLKVLKSFGLRDTDPRFAEMMQKIKKLEEEEEEEDQRNFLIDRKTFKDIIHPSVELISRSLRNHLVIPSWGEFCGEIKELFEQARAVDTGEVATYIPQLSRQNPDWWGISICTVDGQRFSLGDSQQPFCFQSVSKAFNYAIVASDLGADFVHSYVGHEPSGRLFNDICLDPNGKPHNPMINAGAIIVTSLIKNGLTMSDRFDFVLQEYKKLCGGEYIGFNNATFLSERDTADRNYALSYYMKENKCFPPGTQGLREELDLYFQLCSLEATCESAAVMAATLANGGVCPLTDIECVHPRPCRDVLSLMYSCGMYDYSGKFSFSVGLPAKSGVSGAMIVVVPNVMGICLFSPPLDKMGNSTRGVSFCKNTELQKLIQTFNFHNYDSLLHAESKKVDPRRRLGSRENEQVVSLLFAAQSGDFEGVRRLFMQGTNMEMVDYDMRTALHVSAAEGHAHLVKFFLSVPHVNHSPKDRWGRTPLDEARHFKHEECVHILLKAQMSSTERSSSGVSSSEDTPAAPSPSPDHLVDQVNGGLDKLHLTNNRTSGTDSPSASESRSRKTSTVKPPNGLMSHREEDEATPTTTVKD